MASNTVSLALSEFAADVYSKVLAHQKDKLENTFLSPISVYTALAVTMAGASGETLQQMLRSLRIPESLSGGNLHASIGSTIQLYFTASDGVDLSLANRLFLIQPVVVVPQFSQTVSKSYGAAAEVLSSLPDVDAKRRHINTWVATNTKGKIDELIPAGQLQSETVLAIINALYFKGSWENVFCKEITTDQEFHCLNGSSKTVRMMFKEERYPFVDLQEEESVAVKLPFKGGAWELLVVLPNERNGLEKLACSLTKSGKLASILEASFEETKIRLHLPRFKLSRTNPLDLKKLLEQCGLRVLFDENTADLSKLCNAQRLHVSDIWHKAVLEVDEEGATAAAATAIGIAPMCFIPTPEVRVDHAFLLAIVCNKTVPVFVGHVVDPEEY